MKKSVYVFVLITAVCICLYPFTPGETQMMGRGMGMMGGPGGFTADVVSRYVTKEPAMDIVDPVWESASGVYVRLMPMGTREMMGIHNTVLIKSIHTDKNIYVYAVWPDYTRSVNKKMWVKQNDGTWKQSKDDEDRIAMIWEIDNSMAGFSGGRGSMALCHTNPNNPRESMMSTRYSGGFGDVWHWKAARTNPVGFADDQYLDQKGREADPGKAAYKDNKSKDGKTPAFMAAKGSVDSPFLLEAKALPFDTARFKPGDMVPAYVLQTPKGDRADIQAYGLYKDGTWTVILKRAMKTGHIMDVRFDRGQNYFFAVAVFDNAGDEYHLKSHLLRLLLE